MASIPPHNLEAEESVLGAMLLSAEAVAAAVEVVTAADFYKPAHGHIFSAVTSLWSTGQAHDQVTVSDVLRTRGQLDDVGGGSALMGLASNTPAPSAAATYAAIVADKAHRRRLMQAAIDAHHRYRDGGDLAEVGSWLQEQVERAIDSTVQPDLVPGREFAERVDDPRSWVIPGLLDRQDRVIIVAGEGSGKMVTIRQIVVAAANGIHPFLGYRITPASVLLVDLENPEREVRRWMRPLYSVVDRLNPGTNPRSEVHLMHLPQGLNLRTPRGRTLFEKACQQVQPDIVAIGPIGKAGRKKNSSESGEDVANELCDFFDDLRIRYGFAMLIEAHAPLGATGMRQMRPKDAQKWQGWPDVGIALMELTAEERKPTGAEPRSLRVGEFRGMRGEREWPHQLHRDGGTGGVNFPWKAWWPDHLVPAAPARQSAHNQEEIF